MFIPSDFIVSGALTLSLRFSLPVVHGGKVLMLKVRRSHGKRQAVLRVHVKMASQETWHLARRPFLCLC